MKIETLPYNRGFLVDDFIIEFSGLIYSKEGKRVRVSAIPSYIFEAKERLLRDER